MPESKEIQPLESFFIQQDKTIELSRTVKKISEKPIEEYIRTIKLNDVVIQEFNIMLYNTNLNGQNKSLLAETINMELQKRKIGIDKIKAIVGYRHNKEYVPNKPYNISAYLVLKKQ